MKETPEIRYLSRRSMLGLCDPVIALWCFVGAPSVYDQFRGKGRGHQAGADAATQPTHDNEVTP